MLLLQKKRWGNEEALDLDCHLVLYVFENTFVREIEFDQWYEFLHELALYDNFVRTLLLLLEIIYLQTIGIQLPFYMIHTFPLLYSN